METQNTALTTAQSELRIFPDRVWSRGDCGQRFVSRETGDVLAAPGVSRPVRNTFDGFACRSDVWLAHSLRMGIGSVPDACTGRT
jgi:hypothetical protein